MNGIFVEVDSAVVHVRAGSYTKTGKLWCTTYICMNVV